MIKKLICFLSIIAYVTSATVSKREEYNPADSLLALANGNRDNSNNNSPVYSSNSYPTYSSNYANAGLSNSNQNLAAANAALNNYVGNQADANANANQAAYDNVASAASNLQGSNLPVSQSNQPNYANNNQGNLYYYYYPVQDKNKEINYQASPSNQYASSIQPQSNDDQSNQNNANVANNQQGNSPNHVSNQDLSYGAQDLAYTASALNENNNGGQSGSNNYESQLSGLASSLNQYGNQFGFGSGGGNAFSYANQLSGLNNLGSLSQNFGEAFGSSNQYASSLPQPGNVPFVNDPAFTAAMANQFSSFPTSSQSGSSGGPLSQLYQQATSMYQGLINGANSASQPQFAASQQHASFEPSAGGGGGSSFRSKYGLGSIMMPLIALAGLSLLIPTVQSLSTVASRKKRSAAEIREDNYNLQQSGLGSYLERIDRYYSLYKNAVERDECMNRIICELGDALSGVRGKDAFFE